jgi:hypothetical protein
LRYVCVWARGGVGGALLVWTAEPMAAGVRLRRTIYTLHRPYARTHSSPHARISHRSDPVPRETSPSPTASWWCLRSLDAVALKRA